MIRLFAEFENDRFLDAGLLEKLIPKSEAKLQEKLKLLQELNILVETKTWIALAKKGILLNAFEEATAASDFVKNFCTNLKWNLTEFEFGNSAKLVVGGPSVSIPSLIPALTSAANAYQQESFNRVPLLVSRSRHSEEILVSHSQETFDFTLVDGAPDSVLARLLNEHTPFAYQLCADSVTIWRMRGNIPASFTIFFDRALESTLARKRTEIILSLLFTPYFLNPPAKPLISAEDVLSEDNYGRYPIEQLRKRFKDTMEMMGTAIYLVNSQQKRGTKIGRGQKRQPEIRNPKNLPIPQQVRTEVSRYLFRLLFLFSSEAKGQITNRMVVNAKDPSIYTTYFIRKRAAAMRRTRNKEWMKKTTFLWDSINDTFKLCQQGLKTSSLEIPPFDGQLFDPSRIPFLSQLEPGLPDIVMCEIIDQISRVTTRHGTHEYCDFKTLQVNHLGEIYQWLLEFEPKIIKGDHWAVRDKAKDEPFFLSEEERKTLEIKEGSNCKSINHSGLIFKMNPKSTVRSQTGTHFTQAALGKRIAEEALSDILRPFEEKQDAEGILNLSMLEPCIGSAGIMAEAVTIAARSVYCAGLKSKSEQDAFRNGKLAISPHQLQYAKRRVVERMVYGVDKMIDAVELARAALWQECATQTLPLPFLNHKVRTGDSLVGTWFLEQKKDSPPRWIYPGITPLQVWDKKLKDLFPEDSQLFVDVLAKWKAAAPDDALISQLPKKIEKLIEQIAHSRKNFLKETHGQRASEQVHKQESLYYQLLDFSPDRPSTDALALIQQTDDDFIRTVERLPEYRRLRMLGDVATALYFWPSDKAKHYPTPEVYKNIIVGLIENAPQKHHGKAELRAIRTALGVAFRRVFFHWEVEFPELFLNGKKPDICLSNPPWDNPNVNEATFWKQHHPLAGKEGFSNEKVSKITAKLKDAPSWEKNFLGDRQFSHFMKQSGDYSTLQDEIDLHRPFVEQLKRLASRRGTLLLPQSLWINENSKESRLMGKDVLGWDRLVGFVNHNKKLFSGVHASYSFGICRYNPGIPSRNLEAIFRVRSLVELQDVEANKNDDISGYDKKGFVSFDWHTVETLAKDFALPEIRTTMDAEILFAISKTGITAGNWLNKETTKQGDVNLTFGYDDGDLIESENAKPGDLPLWRGGHFHIWKPYFQQEDSTKPFEKGQTHWVQLPEQNGKILQPHTSLVVKKKALEALPKVIETNGTVQLVPWEIADEEAGKLDSTFVSVFRSHGQQLVKHLGAANEKKIKIAVPILEQILNNPEKTPSEEEISKLLKAKKKIIDTLHNILNKSGNLIPIYETWRLAWRTVASSTNTRSLIVSPIPPNTVCAHSAYVLSGTSKDEALFKSAILGSLVADTFIRFYTAMNMAVPQVAKIPTIKFDPNSKLCRLIVEKLEKICQLKSSEVSLLPSELNAIIAVAFTLETNSKFVRKHFEYILDTYFPALFTQGNNNLHRDQTTNETREEAEEKDRGTPHQLDRNKILEFYDEYLKEFGS